MSFWSVKLPSGSLIFSNFPTECSNCMLEANSNSQKVFCKKFNKEARRAKRYQSEAEITYCSTDANEIKSSRLFKERIRVRAEIAIDLMNTKAKMEENSVTMVKRMLHNLKSLNALNIQEIYSYIPQDDLANATQSSRRELIQAKVKADHKLAAEMFSRFVKNSFLMKVELNVFEKLYDTNPRLDKRFHPVRKVVLNILHVFFPDFADKDISIQVDEYEDKVMFDYDSIAVVLFHIIENASKYMLPKTRLKITFFHDGRTVKICFDMVSIRIDKAEEEKIFDEGFKGHLASTLSLHSKGVGLYLARRLLGLNSGLLNVFCDLDIQRRSSQLGIPYENNQFVISLPIGERRIKKR